ncbi:MAG: hypothetical protein BYD32DRAFT_419054 [Podila humilis]|nr:MAG: hypothetical protein BYD32DRAFT_419054 [Podila humilis]
MMNLASPLFFTTCLPLMRPSITRALLDQTPPSMLKSPLDQLHSPQLGMVETNNSNAKKFWSLLFGNPTINHKLDHPPFESSSLP